MGIKAILKKIFIKQPTEQSNSLDKSYKYIEDNVDKNLLPFQILDYVGYTEECQALSDYMLLSNNNLDFTVVTKKQLDFLSWYYSKSSIDIKQSRTYTIDSQKILDYLVDRKFELKRSASEDVPSMTPYQVLYYMIPSTYYSRIGDFRGKEMISAYFNSLSRIEQINFQLAVIGYYYDEISIVC